MFQVVADEIGPVRDSVTERAAQLAEWISKVCREAAMIFLFVYGETSNWKKERTILCCSNPSYPTPRLCVVCQNDVVG